MKLIKPSIEILHQEPFLDGIFKQIERAGRICYKSENNITSTSAPEFVERMIKSRHGAMLEHGTVYLIIPEEDINNWFLKALLANKYSCVRKSDDFTLNYITTNYRVLVEHSFKINLLNYINNYIAEPTRSHHPRISVKIITSIGITRELVRHRVFSFANESTRYCNYSNNNKFDNGIIFIEPKWLADNTLSCRTDKENFIKYLESAEQQYNKYISLGYKAQDAREILPLCTKSEIIMTGFLSDWLQFFKLRCDKNAHPDMQIIANMIKEKFEDLNYI